MTTKSTNFGKTTGRKDYMIYHYQDGNKKKSDTKNQMQDEELTVIFADHLKTGYEI